MGIWDRSGTASIANGATAVTGSGTTWLVYARIGDRISFNGGAKWYEVAAVNSNTSITLGSPFGETTIAAGAYAIDPSSYRHQVQSDILEQMRLLLASQTDLLETTGAPSPSLGADKSLAFDPAARVYYYKVNGVWGDPVSLGGSDGVDAGFKNQFSTPTGMSDPGNGFVRFNNATRASVTAIAIADRSADAANPDVSNYILTWDDSTSPVRGTIIFRKVGAALNFAIFQITGVSVDNTGWTQLAVTHVASGGTFAASDDLSTVFVRAGDRGTPGIDGVSAGSIFNLSTNTTIADPGPGTLRFNNASLPSATLMAIDATSAAPGNPDIRPFILTWDDSTNSAHRGVLTFTKLGAQENFAIFAITGALVDNTGWLQISLAYVSGGGTLGNGDVLVVQFSRTGNKGADGLSAGLPFIFSTNTTIADPGAGSFRLSSATPSAVTSIAVSDVSAEPSGPNIASILASWDDSSNLTHRGTITLRKLTAPQNFAQYAINSSITPNSGWSSVPVSHVASSGSFSAADIVTFEFARTGDKGIDGTGAGDVVAINNLNDLSDKQAAFDNLSIRGADIASASTINLDAATGSLVDVTGTTTIATVQLAEGRRRRVRFTGALTLVHGSALVLPGSANIVTAAGDYAEFIGYPSSVVRCLFTRGNGFPLIALPSGRELLSANRIYYVRTDGSNSNTGLADNAGGAFLTIQKAMDQAFLALDLNGYNVDIVCRTGAATAFFARNPQVGRGNITITGDTTTPANCTITAATGDCVEANAATFEVRGFRLVSTTGNGISLQNGARVRHGNIEYGTCGLDHVVSTQSTPTQVAANTIIGGAQHHHHIADGSVAFLIGQTLTISGTPAFSERFIGVNSSKVRWESMTVVGACTGIRFLVHRNSCLDASGALQTAIPGSIPGIVGADSAFLGEATTDLGNLNRIINGAMRVNQYGSGSYADDTYAVDRHYVLTQTAAITVTTLGTFNDNQQFGMRMTQAQATAQRFGMAHIVENQSCHVFRGRHATLQASVRCSSTQNIRITLLEWTGAIDLPVSDVVNDWASTSYTAGGFFNSTTLAVVSTSVFSCNTGDNIIQTSGLVSSSMRNLICVITTDSAQAQNFILDVGNMQLERGSVATPFQLADQQAELNACLRYYQRVAIGDSIGSSSSTTAAYMLATFPAPMRTSPAASLLGGGSTLSVNFFGAGVSSTASYTLSATSKSVNINANSLSPARTAFIPCICNTVIVLNAEL